MTAGPARILVVDDERQIRRLLRTSLSAQGYQVVEAMNGEEALALAATAEPALVLLDLGLPDLDGTEVIRRIREWSAVPIVALTVRSSEEDKVRALDAGADDYVTKPFGMAELLARVRAGLRRRIQESGASPVYRFAGLVVDLVRRLVTVDGQEVRLSPKEYELLRVLVQNAGRVVTHRLLLNEVWGPAHVEDTQYLRVYVGQLRQKLADDPLSPRFILTEPGVGYRLQPAESPSTP